MDNLRITLDMIMCCMWSLTYTLVLIGTKNYNYPLISPFTQAIIAPYEFAILCRLLVNGNLGFDYVSASYIYWSVIEVATIILMLRCGFIQKKWVIPYIALVCCVTCMMWYLVVYKDYVFSFAYINTFIGQVIWLKHVLKKDYPMKPLVLLIFVAKFVGDILLIQVYIDTQLGLMSILCVLLPILEFMFIGIYFLRRNRDNSFCK